MPFPFQKVSQVGL